MTGQDGFAEDLTACAALVQRGDPDRFMAAMAAPVAARRVLFPIYAMNVEVARAPWVTQEAMIAEMRLQWWRDAVAEIAAGGLVRRHEVVTPLAEVLRPDLAAQADEMIAVRRWDIYRDPFEDSDHFERYIEQTAGTLMWLAARMLGAAEEEVVRDFAFASGLANWFRAIPELEVLRRVPLLDGTPDGVRALARHGLARLARARARRREIGKDAGAALLAGWQGETILRQVVESPARVAEGRLGASEARKRLGLMWQAAAGRW
ncbi:squalene/phytoene synthase family protein [Sedimentitalea todarodis]|uniref:Squalene/phytoene synthase family protein n=1 Tax=Sedimentitalea todarodis TaxID=1631240 RepID=A0ABU3VC34_9RHOB|nr:squalene/phytoene synthase family protein [Sedimentitalea todarodis]MDU9003741.1 squalene/phytoene synthase family protein [Sedimentitalea todarodis]